MALVKEAAALAVTRIFCTIGQPGEAGAAGIRGAGQLTQPDITSGLAAGSIPLWPASAALPLVAGVGGVSMAAAVAAAASVHHVAIVALPGGKGGAAGRFGTGPLGPTELAGLAISMADFEMAVGKVQPSVRREVRESRSVAWRAFCKV